MNLLLPILVATSFSLRTPNVEPNPLDFEWATSIQKEYKSDVFKYDLFGERQWERELGEYYFDDTAWIEMQKGIVWSRYKYLNKTSKGINFFRSDARFKIGAFSFGGTHRKIEGSEEEKYMSFGWKDKDTFGKFTYEINADLMTDFSLTDYFVVSKLSYPLGEEVGVYGNLKWQKVKDFTEVSFKVGIEVLLGVHNEKEN